MSDHICDRKGAAAKVSDESADGRITCVFPTCSVCGKPQVLGGGDHLQPTQGTPALWFHERAWPFLSRGGFELIDDPLVIRNTYQVTWAKYRSAHPFFLLIGFDPFDGNDAQISCGREWRHRDGGWFSLSNDLSTLATLFGLEIPRSYALGRGAADIRRAVERILADLERVLPPILQRVKLKHLVSIEREEFGAPSRAFGHYGTRFADLIEVSDFRAELKR